MAIQLNLGNIQFGVQPQAGFATPSADTPLRILVLANFSGRSSEVAGSHQGRPLRAIEVNRDNIEDLPGKLAAHCEVAFGDDQVVSLQFGRMSDFHPDSLLDKVPHLAHLRDLRAGLQHPSTFEKAAREIRTWGGEQGAGSGEQGTGSHPEGTRQGEKELLPAPSSLLQAPSGGSLLEQAITLTPQSSRAARGGSGLPEPLQDIVRRGIGPLRVPKAASDSATLNAAVDAALGQVLRSILHDCRFQALEAAWRGLDFLVKRLPGYPLGGPRLKVFACDYGLAELKTDLALGDGLESLALHHVLVEQTVNTPGGEPWGLIVGDYTFEATSVDLLVAGCLARLACWAGAPLIAAASPWLVGCESLAETPDPRDWLPDLPAEPTQGVPSAAKAWDGLRNQAEASYLGLVLPRFLLRMPYGPESSPLDRISFTELLDPAEHEAYLWGNGAFACAALLGGAFHERGWRMHLQEATVLGDLPIFGAEREGEYYLQPCAETLLSIRAAERIHAAGLMPLMSVKGTGTVQLAGWRSVAASDASLSGRWA
jgi:type VI secretion system protein ImpC